MRFLAKVVGLAQKVWARDTQQVEGPSDAEVLELTLAGLSALTRIFCVRPHHALGVLKGPMGRRIVGERRDRALFCWCDASMRAAMRAWIRALSSTAAFRFGAEPILVGDNVEVRQRVMLMLIRAVEGPEGSAMDPADIPVKQDLCDCLLDILDKLREQAQAVSRQGW